MKEKEEKKDINIHITPEVLTSGKPVVVDVNGTKVTISTDNSKNESANSGRRPLNE